MREDAETQITYTPTSEVQDTEIMSLDCQSTRESYLNDPCGGRCSSTCSVHAEGPGKIVENTQQELGCRMSTVSSKSTGVDLVAHSVTDKEWTADTEAVNQPKDFHLRGRVSHRMGNFLARNPNQRLLESRRTVRVDKRPRVENNFICPSTARKKVRPLNHTTFY
ncbi:hypothetical protein G6F38_013559 [Rhizopus arrhizus]|nr:hypothetical protein G6F38_013559 [Rhizopus arrhizus]